MKIRTNDTVVIISGKDKGVKGKVLKVFTKNSRILVQWANFVTRHYKKQGTTPGQIVKKENPLHVSNVMLECPFTSKPTRVGYVMVEEKGKTKKFRFSKKALQEKWGEARKYIIK